MYDRSCPEEKAITSQDYQYIKYVATSVAINRQATIFISKLKVTTEWLLWRPLRV